MLDSKIINKEIQNWFLEESNPSVKYWTLRDILDIKPDDVRIINTRKQIMQSDCVNTIMVQQINDAYWSRPFDMYNPKYKGTTHTLLILAELGATVNQQIKNAIEYIFQFQRNSGHFLIDLPKTERGKASTVFDGCCVDGNILTYLILFGYIDDPRVQRLLEFTVDYHDETNTGWPCRSYSSDTEKVFPKHCYMGRMKVLKGISFIPKAKISKELKKIVKIETEHIFENEIWKYLKKKDGSRKEKAGWTKFGFPLFYNSDVLEILDILTRLNIKDDRMQEAITRVISKRQKDGRWLLENTFNGKMWCDIEEKNKPYKWITLRALRVLQNYLKV